MAQDNPKVVEDLVPKLLPLATVQRVIQNMLRERVPIRDAVGILEALGEAAQSSKNPVLLTEYVRQSIRRGIVKQLVNAQGEITGVFARSVHRTRHRIVGRAWRAEQHSDACRRKLSAIFWRRLGRKIEKAESAVVIASAGSRHFLRQIAGIGVAQLDGAFAQRDSAGSEGAFAGGDRMR